MKFAMGIPFGLLASVCLTSLAPKILAKDNSRQDCVLDKSGKICTLTEAETRSCETYREFSTTFNYLLAKKSSSFTKDQATRTAMRVAKGCNGAAERFIRVFNLLVNAEIALAESTQIAEELAQADGDSAESFVKTFKLAYLQSSLDLSLQDSLNLARRLSIDILGSSVQASDDFRKIVNYCLNADGLALPKPDCAKLSLHVVALAENTKDKSIADGFIELVEFLRTQADGPKLVTHEAVDVAKELVAIHPDAGKNFIPAYRFASDKAKLGLNRNEAVTFARNLAQLSRAPAGPMNIKAAKDEKGDQNFLKTQ